jgi:FkbM family methyltransferase
MRHLARRLLRLLPKDTMVPILRGPLRGTWWTMHSGVHTYWRGVYERELARQIGRAVRPGMVCYDCGANVGYFTLLFSRLVGGRGHVFSFEPLPENAAHIQRHILVNRCSNVTVLELALADYSGKAGFSVSGSTSKIEAEGEIEVACATLDSLGLPAPDVVKVDVEGAEILLIKGAERTIRTHHPTIFMSLHIPIPSARDLAGRLRSIGYDVTFSDSAYEFVAVPVTRRSV